MSTSPSLPRRQNTPSNPRRPPAHLSVSLVHGRSLMSAQPHPSHSYISKPSSPNKLPAGEQQAAHPSHATGNDRNRPDDQRPGYSKKQSSGESSNADRWFETSNNDVAATNASLMDGELLFIHLQPIGSRQVRMANHHTVPMDSRRTSLLPPQFFQLLHASRPGSAPGLGNDEPESVRAAHARAAEAPAAAYAAEEIF